MNISQLDANIARLDSAFDQRKTEMHESIYASMRAWHSYCNDTKTTGNIDVYHMLDTMGITQRAKVASNARTTAGSIGSYIKSYGEMLQSDREYINRHEIERQRKFTLSIACLLLFLIGAPFGSIVRKGGLGLPLVASVGFFVLYYVVGMISEKAVRESALGPEGMWVSSLVMLPIGILLTLQATTDSSFFDASSWKKFFDRIFPRMKKKTVPKDISSL